MSESGGSYARNKGRMGQTNAQNLLLDRDWQIAQITAGIKSEDILATDPDGKVWSVEVKNTRNIMQQHYKQAREQAKARRAKWMTMHKLHGSRSWLINRQGCEPVIWAEKGEENSL